MAASTEINEKLRLNLGVKEFVTILASAVMVVGGYFTIKMNTENAIHDLRTRIEKIEEVKPELLQYKMGELSSEMKTIKLEFEKTNEKIEKIYQVLIAK